MRILLALVLFAVAPPSLVGQERSSGEEHFLRRREYLLAAGGRWLAANPGFQAGEAVPSHFGYEFAPGLGPTALRIRITGLVGADTVEYWSGVYFWDPDRNRAEYRSVAAWGATASGRDIGPDALAFEIAQPDGTCSRHLDRETIMSDAEFRSDSYVQRDGAWLPNQTLMWKRAPG